MAILSCRTESYIASADALERLNVELSLPPLNALLDIVKGRPHGPAGKHTTRRHTQKLIDKARGYPRLITDPTISAQLFRAIFRRKFSREFVRGCLAAQWQPDRC